MAPASTVGSSLVDQPRQDFRTDSDVSSAFSLLLSLDHTTKARSSRIMHNSFGNTSCVLIAGSIS